MLAAPVGPSPPGGKGSCWLVSSGILTALSFQPSALGGLKIRVSIPAHTRTLFAFTCEPLRCCFYKKLCTGSALKIIPDLRPLGGRESVAKVRVVSSFARCAGSGFLHFPPGYARGCTFSRPFSSKAS